MLGLVQVAGAEPGDVVEVSITARRTIGWGWNSFRSGWGRRRTTSPSRTRTTLRLSTHQPKVGLTELTMGGIVGTVSDCDEVPVRVHCFCHLGDRTNNV